MQRGLQGCKCNRLNHLLVLHCTNSENRFRIEAPSMQSCSCKIQHKKRDHRRHTGTHMHRTKDCAGNGKNKRLVHDSCGFGQQSQRLEDRIKKKKLTAKLRLYLYSKEVEHRYVRKIGSVYDGILLCIETSVG